MQVLDRKALHSPDGINIQAEASDIPMFHLQPHVAVPAADGRLVVFSLDRTERDNEMDIVAWRFSAEIDGQPVSLTVWND